VDRRATSSVPKATICAVVKPAKLLIKVPLEH
jgi:hypothetical protein